MYIARNGFTLDDDMTPQGWQIRDAGDILTALLAFPYFETVADCFIWEALAQAMEERKHYQNIEDLAQFMAENFI